MKKAEVAIITRTKNRNLLLNRALKSVVGQTFKNWCMVIVNDGGEPTGVDELIKPYIEQGYNISVVHNPQSLGMEAASNVGINNSSSDYVVIHDDDDSWHPDFLEKCIGFFKNNSYKSVKGVITHTLRLFEKINGDDIVVYDKKPFCGWVKGLINFYTMTSQNLFAPIAFVYERSVIDEIGGYREDFPVLGDWEFNLRFLMKYDIYVIPEKLAYNHHRTQIKTGELSNTIRGEFDNHLMYNLFLKNELLREDVNNGKFGLGFLLNISSQMNQVKQKIDGVNSNVNNKSSFFRFIKKLFKKK